METENAGIQDTLGVTVNNLTEFSEAITCTVLNLDILKCIVQRSPDFAKVRGAQRLFGDRGGFKV